jgi:MraZ protein
LLGRGSFVPLTGSVLVGLGRVSDGPVMYSGKEITAKVGGDRFVLPPEFRHLVRESSNGQRIVCLQAHPTRPCLMGFGLSHRVELEARIDKEEAIAIELGKEFDREDREIELFSFEKIPFDDSGRFALPIDLLEHAGITDKVYFQGSMRHFLIYSPDLVPSLGDDHATIKRNCAAAMGRFRAGKGAK